MNQAEDVTILETITSVQECQFNQEPTANNSRTTLFGKFLTGFDRSPSGQQVVKQQDLWLDIGARNKAEAAELVRIGDPVTLQLGYQALRNNLANAPGMDDKTGLWVVLEAARRASPVWHKSFSWLYHLHGRSPMRGERSKDFDSLRDVEVKGIAGSPKTVTAWIEKQMREIGANYLVGQFAFGDLSEKEVLTSIDLFSKHCMPALRGQ